MENIFELCKTMIGTCIACSLITILFHKTTIFRAVRFVCSVIILAYMLHAFLPLYSVVGDLINVNISDEITSENGEPKTENNYISSASVGICQSVKYIICGRYEIPENDLSVSITINTDNPENIIIKSVTVSLNSKHKNLADNVSEYIGDLLGCGCIVLLK